MTNALVTKVNPAKVVRAYNGKVGCMCGCLGNYSEAHTKATVRRVNMLNQYLAAKDYDRLLAGKEWVSVERNGRNLTVYFCD